MRLLRLITTSQSISPHRQGSRIGDASLSIEEALGFGNEFIALVYFSHSVGRPAAAGLSVLYDATEGASCLCRGWFSLNRFCFVPHFISPRPSLCAFSGNAHQATKAKSAKQGRLIEKAREVRKGVVRQDDDDALWLTDRLVDHRVS